MFILRRAALGVAIGAVFAIIAGAASSCSKSPSGVGIADNCSINSDCDMPYVCAFGRCHVECKQQRDCTSGQRCVASTAAGVCQLTSESTCSATTLCVTGQSCGGDMQCRVACTSGAMCSNGDYCVTTGTSGACYSPTNTADEPVLIAAGILAPDGAIVSDASTVMVSPDGGVAGPDGSGGPDASGGTDGGDGGPGGNSCPSAQTQFGVAAQGDSNPNFRSGVGVRTPTQLVIFDGYFGPDPTGADAGDAGSVTYVFAQAFDPATGKSQGPAKPLLPGAPDTNPLIVEAAAVAPTGEIALLYWSSGAGLWVSFLTEGGDGGAGAAGLQVNQSFQVEVNLQNQPHAIWSNASKAFVFSWKSNGGYGPVKVQKYLPNGQVAGGATDPVPTDQSSAIVAGYPNQASVAASNDLFGVAYVAYATNYPSLTVLDSQGNQVGGSFPMESATTSTWVTAGGTKAGFVSFYDVSSGGGGIGELLVPVGSDAGVLVPQPGDAGDAGAFPGFRFGGTKSAVYASAVNDDVGGAGGVGVAILYNDSVAFAYVNADGLTHVSPTDLISHTYASQTDYINVNNVGGSFGVSLYNGASHSVQAVASGCAP